MVESQLDLLQPAVAVGVQVDEPGRQEPAARVDDTPGSGILEVADRRDPSLVDRNVGHEPRISRPVQDLSAPDQDIVDGRRLGVRCRNPRENAGKQDQSESVRLPCHGTSDWELVTHGRRRAATL